MVATSTVTTEYMRPLCNKWLEKVRAAYKSKEDFSSVAKQCMGFFSGGANFMWQRDYMRQYMGSTALNTRFPISINKAFELVALFGPTLYWRNPHRMVNPRKRLSLPQEAFMSLGDPMAMMLLQNMQQEQQFHNAQADARAVLMEVWLNYTPGEMPGGGLSTHASSAITEALVKGRGCLAGGTHVYARVDGRVSSVRARDIHRMKQKGTSHLELWDGDAWSPIKDTRQIPRCGDELKLTLRSGEEVHCTADHIWPTQRGLLNADMLKIGDSLKYVKLPNTQTEEPEHLPDEIAWFVGIVLGDGFICQKRNGRIGIAGHIAETSRHERVEKIVKSYGGSIRWISHPGTNKRDADIHSPVLKTILDMFISGHGAHKKHLKSACWERSDEFLRNLLQGYFDSDGYNYSDGCYRLHFCRNKDLADDLRELCARLGYRIILRLKEYSNGKIVYRGSITTRDPKCNNTADLGQIVSISKADHRCDYYYDIAMENSPHTYTLSSGLLTHNCLWAKPYMRPGSDKVMTGCFYDSVDNLLIDPDATSLTDAKWIAQRVRQPVWEAERIHNLPPGTLRQHVARYEEERAGKVGFNHDPMSDMDDVDGESFEMIEYYRIFSKAGIGSRLSGMGDSFTDKLDREAGDYAYIVVARGVPFPLNAHPERIRIAEDGQRGTLFRWPIPSWRDGDWPCCVLDFYEEPNNPWPIAPLAPGLGELHFINILLSSLADHIYDASKMYLAGRKDMIEKFEQALRQGHDFQPIAINGTGHQSINDVIAFLQPPNLQTDVWKILDALMMEFDKRTGLSEILYGMNPGGKQIRTAEDAALRGDMTSRRPDFMAARVEDWMTRNAKHEMNVTRQFIEATDVDGLMGQAESYLWQSLINEKDPDLVYRDLEAVVMANSTRRPDKTREVANINQTLNTLLPMLQQYAAMTGQFGPLNNYIEMWGKAIEMDVSGLMLQPPPPPPQQQQGPDPAMIENEQAQRAQQVQMEHLQQAHDQKMAHNEQQFQQKMNQQTQQAAMKALMQGASQPMMPAGVM